MNHFHKTKRLLAKIDYETVFDKSNKLVTPEFIILYCHNTLGHARLGLAISKKRMAKAHDRNRIKRLVRETFRTSPLPALDIVVLAKSNLAKIQNSTLIASLSKAWNKLSI